MIKPIGDRVVLRRKKAETKSTGGIFLPESAQERLEAEVVAVGPGKQVGNRFVETTVKAGDTVLLAKYAGVELNYKGEDLVVVHEEEIVGVIK